MIQKAVVTSVEGGYATVEIIRSEECGSCDKRAGGGCIACTLIGGTKRMSARAKNKAGAVIGDTVSIESSEKRNSVYSLIMFILPIALAVAAYYISIAAGASEAVQYLSTMAVLLLTAAAAALIIGRIAKKRCDLTIVSVDGRENAGSTD